MDSYFIKKFLSPLSSDNPKTAKHIYERLLKMGAPPPKREYRRRRHRAKFFLCCFSFLLFSLLCAFLSSSSSLSSSFRGNKVATPAIENDDDEVDYNNNAQQHEQHEQQNDDDNDDDNEKEEEEHNTSILLNNNNIHHQKRNNNKHRIGGSGTGASKQLGFMNENLVSKLKELGEKRQLEEEEEEDSKKPSFKGSFVMNKRRRKMNEEIPFPRKKLRDTLQHYSLGKAKRDLIRVIPEEDEVRLTLLTRSNRKSSSSNNNNNSFRKKNVCAVIGNGGTLLAYDLGEEIDSADVIIRLNAGPIKGFEKKVGSRTDYRLVNRLHMGFRETKEEMVLQHCTTPDALDEWTRFKVKHEDDINVKKKLFAIDPDFHELAISYTDKGVVSNGFYGLLLATELCDQVKVYGFFRKWKGNVYYHYYNGEAPNEGQSFRDDKEGDRLEMWLKERHATHKMGEPCLQQESDEECKNCAPGLVCAKTAWHPVPKPGYCYDEKHPETPANAKGLPRANCARKCGNSDICPGGKRGFCSKSLVETSECVFSSFVR